MSILSYLPTSTTVEEGDHPILPAVTDIRTLTAFGKVYVKWTDP